MIRVLDFARLVVSGAIIGLFLAKGAASFSEDPAMLEQVGIFLGACVVSLLKALRVV